MRNLAQLRTGIIEVELERNGGEAVKILRKQYERMRGMLGDDMPNVERCTL